MRLASTQRALSKLRWRCRRGLLENDLLIERFFARHGAAVTEAQAEGLDALMDLADNDLLDLLAAAAASRPRTSTSAEVLRGAASCCVRPQLTRPLIIRFRRPFRGMTHDPVRRESHPVVLRRQPRMDLPIYKGTIGPDVIDIRKLYAQTGKFTYDPGFLSTASCNSTITYIDGDKGELLYRGYPIEQLAENCDFLETCYLLLNGELPNADAEGRLHASS